jgi:L-threonylcarbamoyladenylate synthase
VTERWPADAEHIASTVDRLRHGAVIAFPTDTLYAVGCRAADPAAVARLYRVKRRAANQPMVWLVRDRTQVAGIAIVDARADALMTRFWPGALTLVLPARDGKGSPTIAVRAPNHPVALALIEQLGEPLASSSANRAAAPPPVDADQVIAGLGDELDIVLDGGQCQIGEPSTILDLTASAPRVLRQGAIAEAELIRG